MPKSGLDDEEDKRLLDNQLVTVDDNEMDDRESIYLDTISITSGSTIGANRRSLALSRQTIYHSAEDIYEDHPNYGLDLTYGGGDYPRNGILKNALSNRDQELAPEPVSVDEVEYYAKKFNDLEGVRGRPEEVTALLNSIDLPAHHPSSHSGNLSSNRTKKETITYSQWKARVTYEHLSLILPFLLIYRLPIKQFFSH